MMQMAAAPGGPAAPGGGAQANPQAQALIMAILQAIRAKGGAGGVAAAGPAQGQPSNPLAMLLQNPAALAALLGGGGAAGGGMPPAGARAPTPGGGAAPPAPAPGAAPKPGGAPQITPQMIQALLQMLLQRAGSVAPQPMGTTGQQATPYTGAGMNPAINARLAQLLGG